MAIQAVICLVGLEVACQAYYYFVVESELEKSRNSPHYFYQASKDPVLVYELERGREITLPGRRLKINQRGIRDDSEEAFAGVTRVGILGDSTTFGTGLSQDATMPADLQRYLDAGAGRIKVLNLGVPGYGLEEMPTWMRQMDEAYRPNVILYLLNMNDFSRRDTIYEGGDNGLYRIFRRPIVTLPFFVRKAIYRYKKNAVFSSVGWYKWLYEGNDEWALGQIVDMSAYAQRRGIRFAVAILPAGVAYTGAGYALAAEQAEIAGFLGRAKIAVFDLTSDLSRQSFDDTDHFTKAGAEEAARALVAPIGALLNGDPIRSRNRP